MTGAVGLNAYLLISHSEPPEAPSNVQVTDKTHNRATIQWNSSDNGPFCIRCLNCLDEDDVVFPCNANLTQKIINITGLKSLATYELEIYNHNDVAQMIDEQHWKKTRFNFTTLSGGKETYFKR